MQGRDINVLAADIQHTRCSIALAQQGLVLAQRLGVQHLDRRHDRGFLEQLRQRVGLILARNHQDIPPRQQRCPSEICRWRIKERPRCPGQGTHTRRTVVRRKNSG